MCPVSCVQNRGPDEVQVPDSQCSTDCAPAAAETCNLEVCPARYDVYGGGKISTFLLFSTSGARPHRWSASESANCSAICGPGQARRVVRCVQTKAGQDVEVDPGLCLQLRRPPDSVPCVVDVCPIGWESEGAVKKKKSFEISSGFLYPDNLTFDLDICLTCFSPGPACAQVRSVPVHRHPCVCLESCRQPVFQNLRRR